MMGEALSVDGWWRCTRNVGREWSSGTRTRGDMAWLVVEAYLDGLVGDEAADPGVWVADVGVATPLYEVVGLGEWATV